MDNRVEIKINLLIEIIPISHDSNTGSNPLHIYQEAIEATISAPNFLEGDELCIIVDRDRGSFSEHRVHIRTSNPIESMFATAKTQVN